MIFDCMIFDESYYSFNELMYPMSCMNFKLLLVVPKSSCTLAILVLFIIRGTSY